MEKQQHNFSLVISKMFFLRYNQVEGGTQDWTDVKMKAIRIHMSKLQLLSLSG